MNKDIRLATSFKGHRKRKKLSRLLGFGAEVYLIDLWLTVAMDCPEGILVGWDQEDIADACNWSEDPKELVAALIESGWLEKDSDGEYIIHDWCEHQGWACKAKQRSHAAKQAANSRWGKKYGINADSMRPHSEGNADSMRPHSEGNADSMRPHSEGNADSNAPSPYPYPSPKYTPDGMEYNNTNTRVYNACERARWGSNGKTYAMEDLFHDEEIPIAEFNTNELCPQCGTWIGENTSTCPNCGASC